MTEGTAIHWFRQDLRIKDNPSLESAAKYKSFIPIYIWLQTPKKDYPLFLNPA
jgi:deoxyribodipyrimidine photolyase